MIRTQIQLTDEQATALKGMASSQGVSMAEVIRQAVDRHLQAPRGPSVEERSRRALAVVGRLHSGRRDVSAKHDAYLSDAYRPARS